MRYYLGVDWADKTHAVWVVDEQGAKVASRAVPHTAAGLSEWGRELDEWRAQGIELWAAIERPEGRVVDFLLDHGVVVYPVNPQALARQFLQAYPTPVAVAALTEKRWQRWASAHRLSDARTQELWGILQRPQLPVPDHVVRAKARLMLTLVEELTAVVAAVGQYREAIDAFFAGLPEAQWIRTLPIGDHGVTAPTLWALLGDAPLRWESWQHLQGHAGTVPVTIRSGQQRVVRFRFACDKALRYVVDQVAFLSLGKSEWARAYYDRQRARGHDHHPALRALGAKWLKIIFVMWDRQIPYDEQHHLATMTRHQLRQGAQKKIA